MDSLQIKNRRMDGKKISRSIIVLSVIGALLYIAGIVFYIIKTLKYYPDDTREHVFNFVSMYLALASVIVFFVYIIAFYKKEKAEALVAVTTCVFALSQLAIVIKHVVEAFHLSIWGGATYGEVWHTLVPQIVSPLIVCVLLTFFTLNFFKGRLSSMVLIIAAIFVLVPFVQSVSNDLADIAFSTNVNYNLSHIYLVINRIAQAVFFAGILLFTINYYDDIKEENKAPVKKKLLTLTIVGLAIVIFVAFAAPLTAPIANAIQNSQSNDSGNGGDNGPKSEIKVENFIKSYTAENIRISYGLSTTPTVSCDMVDRGDDSYYASGNASFSKNGKSYTVGYEIIVAYDFSKESANVLNFEITN